MKPYFHLNILYKSLGILLAIPFGFCISCLQAPKKNPNQVGYFDLKSYFEKKQGLFESKKFKSTKTLYFEGRKQSLEVAKPEWSRELVFFKESDINKPAWSGKFQIENQNGNLIYNNLDTSRVNIRQVVFYHFKPSDSSFDSLKIVKKESNYLSQISSILVFKPDSAYSIIYNQDIRFYKGSHYALFVKLRP